MLKNNTFQMKTKPQKALGMKIIMSLIVLYSLFFSIVSAEVTKSFIKDSSTSKYGKVELNDRGVKTLDVELLDNTDYCFIYCSAEGKTTLYKESKLIDDLQFKKLDKTTWKDSSFNNYKIFYKMYGEKDYKEYKDEILTNGTYYWRIEGKKQPYEQLDWIGTFGEVAINEWAVWGTSSNIVAYYKFDELTGNKAVNSVNNSIYNMTFRNSSSWYNGKINNGFFPNGSEKAQFGLSSSYFKGNLSLNVWINNSRNGSDGNGNLLSNGNCGGTVGDFIFYFSGYNFTSCVLDSSSAKTSTLFRLRPSEWDMLTLIVGTSDYKIYVNGVLNQTIALNNNQFTGGDYIMTFFNDNPDTVPLKKVRVDELGLWNKTLTSSEITELYNFGQGLTYNGAVNYTVISLPDTISGRSEEAYLTVNTSGIIITTSNATLIYNNQRYLMNKVEVNADHTTFRVDATAPTTPVPIALDYYFEYYINSAKTTTINYTQQISIINISDCSITTGLNILNFTVKDENTFLNIDNDTLEVDIKIKELGTNNVLQSYYNLFYDNETVRLCITPTTLLDSANYSIDIVGSYLANDYTKEFYYLDNGILSKHIYLNSFTNKSITLYDLPVVDTTRFLFKFTGADSLTIPDAIVVTYRKYIGSGGFREIERSRQDDNGQTLLSLIEEDEIYYSKITLNGEVIYQSLEYTPKCLSTTAICEISLSATSDYIPFSTDYDNSILSNYTVEINKTSRLITLRYLSIQDVLMNLSVFDNSDNLINQSSMQSSIGTLLLTVPQTYGNNTFYLRLYENNIPLNTWIFSIEFKGWEIFGVLGLFVTFLILLTIVLVASDDGIIMIVSLLVGLVLLGILTVINLNWGAFMVLVFIGAVIIFKLGKKKR